jgi:chorismate mutase
MAIRGIRGATTVKSNDAQLILGATQELLQAMIEKNSMISTDDIASIIFTATEDLDADFPAHAAREMGLNGVPLLCAREIPVQDSLPRTIRILIHWNTDTKQENVKHIYLGEATVLRPDIQNSINGN